MSNPCELITGLGLYSGEVWGRGLDLLLGLSALLELLVAYSIFYNDKLATHPAYLVGLIALTEGFYSYLGLTRWLLCNVLEGENEGWPSYLFATTVFWDAEEKPRAYDVLV